METSKQLYVLRYESKPVFIEDCIICYSTISDALSACENLISNKGYNRDELEILLCHIVPKEPSLRFAKVEDIKFDKTLREEIQQEEKRILKQMQDVSSLKRNSAVKLPPGMAKVLAPLDRLAPYESITSKCTEERYKTKR